MLRALAWFQGVFYVLTGLWPILHMPSFEWVTGPKVDDWLVKTVGLLITVIGAVLLVAARRGRIGPEVVLLAVGSAGGLAAVDAIYAFADRISDIYLMDAIVEIGLGILWIVAWLRRGSAERAS